MATSTTEITLPSLRLSIDQLLSVIRELDSSARARIARALMETEMDTRLRGLIRELASRVPVDDLEDFEIQAEVAAVRRAPAC